MTASAVIIGWSVQAIRLRHCLRRNPEALALLMVTTLLSMSDNAWYRQLLSLGLRLLIRDRKYEQSSIGFPINPEVFSLE